MKQCAFPSYVNVPPIAKTRSTSHLVPTSEHQRSVSYEEMTTASTSTDSAPEVRMRSDSSQVSCDSPPLPMPKMYVAAYEYVAQKDDELDLPLGSLVKLVTAETHEDGWFRGEIGGKVGLFPSNYTRLLPKDHLVEFKADDIRKPDPSKALEEFQIGYGATAIVYKMDIRIKKELQFGRFENVVGDKMKAALKRFKRPSLNSRGELSPLPEEEQLKQVEQIEQLKREANLVNGLSHNNIVRLLGICLEDPYFGLLLELCEGSSLHQVCRVMNTETAIPLRVLNDWAQQVAEGMEYLTKAGYVHRDLKANNVLVKEEVCLCMDEETMKFDWCSKCGRRPLDKLQLKITDFGGTRKMSNDANRFSSAGTYAWLAPESFRDGIWSESSDVWSYGVVLWELLSREEPYQGLIPAAIAFQIVMRGQSLLINESCPAKWKNIMQKCWSLEPEKRPTFSTLARYFKDYAKELKEPLLQRAPSKMAVKEIYTECFVDQRKELEKMFNDLYSDFGVTNSGKRRSIAPETKARKVKNQKGKKLEITGPMGDVKHLISVQLDKSNEKNFKIKYNDENSIEGTLPRLSDRQTTLSISSPDLHQLPEILGTSGTIGHNEQRISRKNAIRHKKNHPNMLDAAMISPTIDGSSPFAKIDNADDLDSNNSKETKKGTLSRAFAKLPWKSNRIVAGPTTRGASALPFLEAGSRSRAQSVADCSEDANTTTKNKISPRPVKQTNLTERFVKETEKDSVMRPGHLPTHHRKSALDQTIPASPNSPDSARNFAPMSIGTSSRRTTANSSCDGAQSYEILVSNKQGVGHGHKDHIIKPSLSDYIPITTEEQTHFEMRPGRPFEINGRNVNGMNFGHVVSPTYEEAGRATNSSQHYYPVGGGCDVYVPISSKDLTKPTFGEVNNSYSENVQIINRNVQNPQYIHCKQNPKIQPRTAAVPIKIQSESNLVSSGWSSQSREEQLNGIESRQSSLSLNEPPTIPAPLPPTMISRSPPVLSISPPSSLAPVLPPRDGSLSPNPRRVVNKDIIKESIEGTKIF